MCGVCACTESRKIEECNCSVDSVVKKMMRRVEMCIDEYLVNYISNKSETILISILSVEDGWLDYNDEISRCHNRQLYFKIINK